jgi:hypothetical protein
VRQLLTMSNTIGSSPRSVPTSRTGPSAPAPETAPAATEQRAPDTFGSSKGMSNDDLKAFTGEEIMGMNKNQFAAFEEAVAKDGGPGMMSLDPQARKAMLRKNIMKAIMEDCQRIAQKHEKNAF